jgi:hypothetical protein
MSILGDSVERKPRGRPFTTVLPPESGEIQYHKWQSPTVASGPIRIPWNVYEIVICDPLESLYYIEVQFGTTAQEAADKALIRIGTARDGGLESLFVNYTKKVWFNQKELSGMFPTEETMRAVFQTKEQGFTQHTEWKLQYTIKQKEY